MCPFRAALPGIEGMEFLAKSPPIPSTASPSRAAVAQSSLLAGRPSRRTDSPLTGTSSLGPPVGWRVRSDIVERERILRGWTRAQLTAAADIDPKTLRDLLNGRRHPTLGTVSTLSRALDVPLCDVIAIIEQPRQAVRLPRVRSEAGQPAQALLPLE